MNHKELFLFVIVLEVFICSCSRTEWVKIGSDHRLETDTYIKPKTITTEGFQREFWTKTVFKRELKFEEENSSTNKTTRTYTVMSILFTCDCAKHTLTEIATVLYNANGDIVKSYDIDYQERRTKVVLPDSMGEGMLEFACEYNPEPILTRLVKQIKALFSPEKINPKE